MNKDQIAKKNLRDNNKWQKQLNNQHIVEHNDEVLLKRALEIVDKQSTHKLK